MVTISDVHRREALCELLSMHDAFDALRGHRLVLEGRPDRHNQLPRLASVYMQAKLNELRDRAALRDDVQR
jgi:hypothetical protein